MKLQKYCFRFVLPGVMSLVANFVVANGLPSSVGDSYLSLGVEHSQSDNIRKASRDPKSGYEQRIDLGIGYFNQTATNYTALDYTAYYAAYSQGNLEDDSQVSGSFALSQEVLNQNFLLNVNHFRSFYLLDQTGVDISVNNGSRDSFTINPVLLLPYSRRTGLELGYSYIITHYSDDKEQNTTRHQVSPAWYYDLNSKTRFKISAEASNIKFNVSGLSYKQGSVNTSLDGRLAAGSYSFQIGYSRLSILERTEEGGIFEFTYQYQLSKHNLSLSVRRELSDTSLGLNSDFDDNEDQNYSDSQVLWIDRIQLQHAFGITKRLNNNNSLYYQQQTPLITRIKEPRLGISSVFNFQNTKKINSFLSLDYSKSTASTTYDKKKSNITLGAQYLFRSKLTFSLETNYEKQVILNAGSSYDELRYTARIDFRY